MKTWLEHHYEKDLNIPVRIVKYVHSAHDEIKVKFDGIEELREYHQAKILQFMKEYQISQRHFNPSNGYGYGDDSRDALDKLFASTLEERMHWYGLSGHPGPMLSVTAYMR